MIWRGEEYLDRTETQDVKQEVLLRLYTTRRYLHEKDRWPGDGGYQLAHELLEGCLWR